MGTILNGVSKADLELVGKLADEGITAQQVAEAIKKSHDINQTADEMNATAVKLSGINSTGNEIDATITDMQTVKNDISGINTKIENKLGKYSESAGFVPINDENSDVFDVYYDGGYGSLAFNGISEPIVMTKEVGWTSKWFGIFISIAYDNLEDLDKVLHLNLELIEGLSIDDPRILSRIGDWSPAGNPVYLNKDDCLKGGSGSNLYSTIVSRSKESTYSAQNVLYLCIPHYEEDASVTNGTKTVWNLQPCFETTKLVMANDLTKDLRNDLRNDLKDTLLNDKNITFWGDSLTAMGGWTTTIGTLSGYDIHNGGAGGEDSKTIMARQGGNIMLINNITIPADTSRVVIADRDVDGGISTKFGNKVTPLFQGGTSHVNPSYIGDIAGTLVWTGANYSDMTGNWEWYRETAGDAVVIDRPTAIRTNFDMNFNGGIQVIFIGQNGGYSDLDDLVQQHKRMIAHNTGSKTFILGLSTGTAAQRLDYETRMTEEFGRYFISLREYLAAPIYDTDGTTVISCYGVRDSDVLTGTTIESNLTSDDINDIENGKVPSPLLLDGTHYTTTTRTVVGNMVYKKMKELNAF